MALLALGPPARVRALLDSARATGQPGRFLTAIEMDVLSALTDRLIPGPPEDPTPGALEAGVTQAIDLLPGAFELMPPLIHASGPFSNRTGARHDDMAHFAKLDRQAELGWRIRLEGSRGLREREFAGPVTGLQEIYRDGLAHLDQRSQRAYGVGFAEATRSDQVGPGQGARGPRRRTVAVLHRGGAGEHTGGDVRAARIRGQPRSGRLELE